MSMEEKNMRHKRTKAKVNMKKFFKDKRGKNEAKAEIHRYKDR